MTNFGLSEELDSWLASLDKNQKAGPDRLLCDGSLRVEACHPANHLVRRDVVQDERDGVSRSSRCYSETVHSNCVIGLLGGELWFFPCLLVRPSDKPSGPAPETF